MHVTCPLSCASSACVSTASTTHTTKRMVVPKKISTMAEEIPIWERVRCEVCEKTVRDSGYLKHLIACSQRNNAIIARRQKYPELQAKYEEEKRVKTQELRLELARLEGTGKGGNLDGSLDGSDDSSDEGSTVHLLSQLEEAKGVGAVDKKKATSQPSTSPSSKLPACKKAKKL